jgi:hypothetical protein
MNRMDTGTGEHDKTQYKDSFEKILKDQQLETRFMSDRFLNTVRS